MNRRTLVLRGLRHYRRTHAGVIAGVAVSAAVLIGALLVGDSVRASLREQALARVGRVGSAMMTRDRLFTSDLGDRVARELGGPKVSAALSLPGFASVPGGQQRAGIVSVYGVEDNFFQLGPSGDGEAPAAGEAVLSDGLRQQLGVSVGETILVRVEKPSLLPRDMVMSDIDETSLGLRVEVAGTVGDQGFGRFGLHATQVAPFNVFLSLSWLQGELQLEGKANLLLVEGAEGASSRRADQALGEAWSLADAGLSVHSLNDGADAELRSDRVFMDEVVVDAVTAKDPTLTGVLTYFVNAIRAGDRSTPYSMVTAMGSLSTWSETTGAGESDVEISDWLAHDLEVEAGAELTLDFFSMGPSLELERRTSPPLKVSRVDPLETPWAKSLTPELPGITDSENCRDWDPSVPVDLKQIRDHDEVYWDNYGAAPKAKVSTAFARRYWRNRFGTLTSIRGPSASLSAAAAAVPGAVDPARLGLFFRDIREQALASGSPATDFGGLFIGLSFFLIVAALLLVALLFVFGVEQRRAEVGTLLALGYTPRRVRRLFLGEACLLSLLGTVLGIGLGVLYTNGVLWALGTLWRGAVGDTSISLHVSSTTVLMGVVCSVLTALFAIAMAMRRAFHRPALELLADQDPPLPNAAAAGRRPGRWRKADLTALGCVVAAVALMVLMGNDAAQAAMGFFGAGAMLLVAALLFCRRMLMRLGSGAGSVPSTVASLGIRNSGRRPGRSLATVALLASGTFLVVAVQAHRLEPPQDPGLRSSGTGGFTFFGRSTLPIPRRLDTKVGQEGFGLDAADMAGVSVVSLRVRDGDDASCLNLNAPRNPQLLGVDPKAFAGRFTFTAAEGSESDPWSLLEAEGEVVPAIGDAASVTWSLHKKIGDTLDYVDEAGRPFKVRIVGAVANSILQGSLVISARHLEERFPSSSGFKRLLLQVPADRADRVAARLSSALSDVGLELTSTAARMDQFNAVQNTYLLVFQALGGLGLLLGSVGLGMVVLRNALERRRELALLAAVGFSRRAVRRLMLGEHGLLLALGLAAGCVTALVAVSPSLRGGGPSLTPMVLLVLGVACNGLLWAWLATTAATRGPLLSALRDQ